MSKKKAIDWIGLFIKYDKPAFLYASLAAIYLAANFLVQGITHVAFTYTMVYALAFLLIGIAIQKVSSGKSMGVVFALMTLFLGILTKITSAGYIDANSGMWLGIVFFVLALLNEYGIIETKQKINSRYCLIGALGGIFLFGLLYIVSRLGYFPVGPTFTYWTGPLPMETLLNHGGITLLAGIDMLIIFGISKWDKMKLWRWIFWGVAVIGALWMLSVNFGLTLA